MKQRRAASAAALDASLPGRSSRSPSRREIISHSAAQTWKLGERMGRLLKGSEVLALCGELGAGKTCFIQGLAKGLDVREPYVCSPTFIFIQQYEGRLTLYHVDLYRIDRASDAEGLGLLDCFHKKSVVAIEWAEKALELLPPLRITIEIKNLGRTERRLRFHIPAEFEDLWARWAAEK